MKRIVQFSFLFFAFLMFLPLMAGAQEEKTNTITITEDGKVTTDTTFEIAEGQDPDAVKEMVEELAGGEIHLKMAKEGHKKVMYIKEGKDEDTWHIHDIDIDSIKEAHGGAHVMVMKTEDGDFNVKVLDEEDEDFEFESEEGGTYIVKVMKHGEDDCDVHVTKDHHIIISEDGDPHGNKKVIVKEYKGGDGEGEKRIKVFIDEDDNVKILEGGEDLEWVEEDEDGGEVIIIKSEDGEKVVVKKQIKVEVYEEDGEKSEGGEKKVVKKKVKKEEK